MSQTINIFCFVYIEKSIIPKPLKSLDPQRQFSMHIYGCPWDNILVSITHELDPSPPGYSIVFQKGILISVYKVGYGYYKLLFIVPVPPPSHRLAEPAWAGKQYTLHLGTAANKSVHFACLDFSLDSVVITWRRPLQSVYYTSAG